MAMVAFVAPAAVLLVAVCFLFGRLLAGFCTRQDEGGSLTVLSYGMILLRLLALGVTFQVIFRYDPGSVVAGVSGVKAGETVVRAAGVLVNAAAITVVGTAANRAISRGIHPAIRSHRPGQYTLPTRFTIRVRAGFAALLFGFAVVVVARQYGFLSIHPFVLVLGAICTWILYYLFVLRPVAAAPIGGFYSRDPTDEERARIRRCYDRFGREPGRILVSENDSQLGVVVSGTGPFRTVGLTESFIDRLTDDQLAVALAQADERARRFQTAVSTLHTLWLLASVYILSSLVDIFPWGGEFGVTGGVGAIVLTVVGALGIAFIGTHNVRLADEFVVSQFDAEFVGEVYRQFDESLRATAPEHNPLCAVVSEPSHRNRLTWIGADTTGVAGDGHAGADEADTGKPADTADEPTDSGPPTQSNDTGVAQSPEPGPEPEDERDWGWPDPDRDYSNN